MNPTINQNHSGRRWHGQQRFQAGRQGLVWNAPAALLVVGLWFWASPVATAQQATFDFDTGAPPLAATLDSVPFTQTHGELTAVFAAPQGGFSVQTADTLGGLTTLSLFSGQFLYPKVNRGSILQMQFNRNLTDISFPFATTDYPLTHPQPTPLVLNLFLVTATGTNRVGSVTNRAAYGSDSYPMGILSFNSGSQTFNRAEIRIQTGGDATFLLDSVTVTTIPRLNIGLASSNATVFSWLWPSTGFLLQQNASLGGTNWVNVTNAVEVVNGQCQVTISPPAGNRFFRLFHP